MRAKASSALCTMSCTSRPRCLISRYLSAGRSMVASARQITPTTGITNAFQIGDGLDDGHNHAQVTGRR